MRLAALIAFIIVVPSSVMASPYVEEMIRHEAAKQGVPIDLALAVSEVESGNRCNAIGKMGERGPLQILVSTARSIGFRNLEEGGCAYQARAGIRHLSLCLDGAGGNRWLAAACHNQGFSALDGSGPTKRARRYADRVMALAANK